MEQVVIICNYLWILIANQLICEFANGPDFVWDLKSESPTFQILDQWLLFCQTIQNLDKNVRILNGVWFSEFGFRDPIVQVKILS